MKSIFIITFVSVIALSVSTTRIPSLYNSRVFASEYEKDLFNHHYSMKTAIKNSWDECSAMFDAPYYEASRIFANPVPGNTDPFTRSTKCLVDCTMRRMGVMSDHGLDEDEYLKQIRKLRYNFTSFDVMEKPKDAQKLIWDAITRRASSLSRFETKGRDLYSQDSCKNVDGFRNHCYDLLMSYTEAAHVCKNKRDPDGDRCETSWIIMRCIMDENRIRYFNGPFYPIEWAVINPDFFKKSS